MRDLKELKALTTELNEKDRQILESESRYRKLIDLFPEAIFIVLKEGDNVIYANHQAAALLHTTEEDIIGRSIYRFLNLRLKDRIEEAIETGFCEEKLQTKVGDRILGDIRISEVEYLGNPAYQLLISDITHVRKIQERYQTIVKELSNLMQGFQRSSNFMNDSHVVKVMLFETDPDFANFKKLKNSFRRLNADVDPGHNTYLLEVADDVREFDAFVQDEASDCYIVHFDPDHKPSREALGVIIEHVSHMPIIFLMRKDHYNTHKKSLEMVSSDILLKEHINDNAIQRSIGFALKHSSAMNLLGNIEKKYMELVITIRKILNE